MDSPGGGPEKLNGHVDRMRLAVTGIVERVGGLAAVQRLLVIFEQYDHAGGGLSANGLAYSALFALVPGILLVLAVVGVVIDNPETEAAIVGAISEAFPPLAPLVQTAFEQVTSGAVPTTVLAIVGLLWGSSRFYAALDYAFSRLFRTAPRRNEVERGLRGILVSAVFVALPIVLVVAGALATWLVDLAPDRIELQGFLRGLVSVGSPLITVVLMVTGVALVYRFVPNARMRRQAYLRPALVAGTGIAIFTQLFTFLAPRMLHWAALFGALISVFAVLVWLSISLNLLVLGAAWTRARMLAGEPVAGPGAEIGPLEADGGLGADR